MTYRVHTSKIIPAAPEVVWELLIDTVAWPKWGPTVRGVEYPPRYLSAGSSGSVQTWGGVTLAFRVTEFQPGHRWAWEVAGIPATDHVVSALGPDSCRLAFGAPALAWPYLAVCRLAMRRIHDLSVTPTRAPMRPPG